MDVFREIIVWPKCYLRIQCIVCGIMLYGTAIYWESIIATLLMVNFETHNFWNCPLSIVLIGSSYVKLILHFIHVMACLPLSKAMVACCQLKISVKFKANSTSLIHENVIKNVVRKMAAILSQLYINIHISCIHYFLLFYNYEDLILQLNTMFIFDRCRNCL